MTLRWALWVLGFVVAFAFVVWAALPIITELIGGYR